MTTERQTVAVTEGHTGAMTRDRIEALFARRQEAYDKLDVQALAADYADGAVIESPISGPHGKAEVATNLQAVFTAFLDMKMITDELVIDDHRVAQVARVEGTNIGGLFGLPPSGKAFRLPIVFIYELRNGQILRERRIYDFTGLLVQVGVLKAKPA